MAAFRRLLHIRLPRGQSAFLWGARKTGKSFHLRQAFPDSISFDLLQTDLHLKYLKEPHRLREELLAWKDPRALRRPIILDEVQKVPALLDEVHGLIESRGLSFILCGSSPRKLKRGHGNLLGGRAWRYEMFPLTTREIPRFDLMTALNRGLLPSHYTSRHARRVLRAYVQDYLREEIMAEGLVRNMPAFTRFMDALAFSHGELTNYQNVARDCGVDAKTVRGYYEILCDTLLGYLIEPYAKKRSRQIIVRAPKFYLFDVGLAGYLCHRRIVAAGTIEFGRALEHFMLMELVAYRGYREKDFGIAFWRTKQGRAVDFVLDQGALAIEVKGRPRVDHADLRGIRAFRDEHNPRRSVVVTCEPTRRTTADGVELVPWKEFLDELWEGGVV